MKQKAELERVDFGGHPKYCGAFGSALFPGRSARFETAKKQNGFGLFDLNPHKTSLGINLQDYTSEKLCPRPTLADLHSDTAAVATAAAATSTNPAAAGAAAAAADAGASLERSVSPPPASAAAAGTQPSQQQQQLVQDEGAAVADLDADAGGPRKRQRLSQPSSGTAAAGAGAAAAAAAAGKPPNLDTLVSVSADLAQNGAGSHDNHDDDFVIIGSSSSSDSGSDSGSDSDREEQQSVPAKSKPASKPVSNEQDGKLIIIGSDDDSDHEVAAGAAPAAAAAGLDGLSAKERQRQRLRRKLGRQPQQEQQQQQQDEDGGAGLDDMSISSSSGSESESESNSDSQSGSELGSESQDDEEDHTDDHTVTMTEEGSEDDEFIPLLDIQPGQGTAAAAAATDSSSRQQQQEQRAVGYQPPWLPGLARFNSPMMRLHNEIVAFCQMLAPTAEEVASRAGSLNSLRDVVRSIWPTADVQVFGSYETGLYTPASDTDVVVMHAGNVSPERGLTALAGALEARHLVRNMQLVLKARVPIIKFEMIDSGLAFDVSWEVPSGPQGAAVVKGLLEQWPALKPLALVLKVFLTQRELNEVYTGGVGSYTLIIMIVAFLQLHQSRRPQQQQQNSHKRRRSGGSGHQAEDLEGNLGLLLVDFMRLYGRVLNLNRVGITAKGSGCFFDRFTKAGFMHSNKGKGGFVVPGRVSLAVEDPIDPTNDTARGSYNMKVVRQVFDHAQQLLTADWPSNESLLGRVIHLAPVLAGRQLPPWCAESPDPIQAPLQAAQPPLPLPAPAPKNPWRANQSMQPPLQEMLPLQEMHPPMPLPLAEPIPPWRKPQAACSRRCPLCPCPHRCRCSCRCQRPAPTIKHPRQGSL